MISRLVDFFSGLKPTAINNFNRIKARWAITELIFNILKRSKE